MVKIKTRLLTQELQNPAFSKKYREKDFSATRKDELRERIPHTWASYNENYLKSFLDSVSHCMVILRATPH